jgi:hypothetical protein
MDLEFERNEHSSGDTSFESPLLDTEKTHINLFDPQPKTTYTYEDWKNHMEQKQAQERKKLENKYRVPSVTDSPIKLMVLSISKVETKGRHHHKKEEVLSE